MTTYITHLRCINNALQGCCGATNKGSFSARPNQVTCAACKETKFYKDECIALDNFDGDLSGWTHRYWSRHDDSYQAKGQKPITYRYSVATIQTTEEPD